MPSSGWRASVGPDLQHVLVDPRQGTRADGDHAVLLPLALTHHDRAALNVQIVKFQPGEFPPAHPRRIKRLQDGAVAQAQGIGDVGLVQHAIRFAGGQHMLGQAFFQPGHFQFARRVVERVIAAGAPLEEGPHRNQVRELAAEGERLAVLLAVVIQMALIPLQQRLGHFRRLRDAALDAPDGEALQVMLAVLDGRSE